MLTANAVDAQAPARIRCAAHSTSSGAPSPPNSAGTVIAVYPLLTSSSRFSYGKLDSSSCFRARSAKIGARSRATAR